MLQSLTKSKPSVRTLTSSSNQLSLLCLLSLFIFIPIFLVAVINQEKTIKNIEGFNKGDLKHAETQEKNPLPDKESEYRVTHSANK